MAVSWLAPSHSLVSDGVRDGVFVPDNDFVVVLEPDRDGLSVADDDTLGDPESDGAPLGVPDVDGVGDCVLLWVRVVDRLPLCDLVPLIDDDVDTDTLLVVERDALCVLDPLNVVDTVKVVEGVKVCVAVTLPLVDGVWLVVADGVEVRDKDGDFVGD